MRVQTLFAVARGDGLAPRELATDDARFCVAGGAWLDANGDGYLHLRAGFAAPSVDEGFGFVHVALDTDGAVLQMAIGETDEVAAQRVLDRLRENDIDLEPDRADALTAAASEVSPASVLSGARGLVSLRAKAYPSEQPQDESLLCLRVGLQGFGAVQLAISDTGRLLAVATGRRDRDAYRGVRHELARKGFELEEADLVGSSS